MPNINKPSPAEIIGVPVYTQSGDYLGQVVKVVLEPNTQQILQYLVGSSNVIKKLFSKKLIINQSQVVSLTKEKMVVFDATVKDWQSSRINLATVPGSE